MLEDNPAVTLTSLPAEIIFEIAVRAPIALRRVVRFDARLRHVVRLQRWLRHQYACRGASRLISVGDRVLVWNNDAWTRRRYATAAAQVGGEQWKIQLLDGTYTIVSTSRVRRLADWADGPSPSSVGLSASLASAYLSRGASPPYSSS